MLFKKKKIRIILCDDNKISPYIFYNVEEKTNSERPNGKIIISPQQNILQTFLLS